jgi:hypothetical protein
MCWEFGSQGSGTERNGIFKWWGLAGSIGVLYSKGIKIVLVGLLGSSHKNRVVKRANLSLLSG